MDSFFKVFEIKFDTTGPVIKHVVTWFSYHCACNTREIIKLMVIECVHDKYLTLVDLNGCKSMISIPIAIKLNQIRV